MRLELTAVIKKVPEGYIGFVEEIPGANAQEETLEELRESLKEAVELVIAANRRLAADGLEGATFREVLLLDAGETSVRSRPEVTESLVDRLDRIALRCASLPVRRVRSEDEILGYGPDGLPG